MNNLASRWYRGTLKLVSTSNLVSGLRRLVLPRPSRSWTLSMGIATLGVQLQLGRGSTCYVSKNLSKKHAHSQQIITCFVLASMFDTYS